MTNNEKMDLTGIPRVEPVDSPDTPSVDPPKDLYEGLGNELTGDPKTAEVVAGILRGIEERMEKNNAVFVKQMGDFCNKLEKLLVPRPSRSTEPVQRLSDIINKML